jgi:hypothetical protein
MVLEQTANIQGKLTGCDCSPGTAEDLFAQYPLTVNGHNFGSQQYDQGKPITNTTELGDFKTGVPVSFDFSHNYFVDVSDVLNPIAV